MKFADELLADVPEDVYLKVLRAFFGADLDSDHPSNILLESLLEAPRFFKHAVAVAFAAGRESAYDRDEWRIVWINRGDGEKWTGCHYRGPDITADDMREALAAWRRQHNPKVWLEHCRAGETPWVRVPEAGDTE